MVDGTREVVTSLVAAGAALILLGTSAAGVALVEETLPRVLLALGGGLGAFAAGWAGRRFLLEARAHAADDAAGREETERLQETAAQRDTLLSAVPIGIVLFDETGASAYANPVARELLGRHVNTLAGLVPGGLRDAVALAAETGDPRAAEFESVGRVVHGSAIPIGTDGRTVLIVRDVTTERRTDRIRRDFVLNASHELKTPAAAILALAETLRDAGRRDPEAAERFLGRLEGEAARLSRLVADLLDLSRLEAATLGETPVRLDRIVVDEAERARPRAEAAGLQLLVEPSEEATVLGSESDLALMVHNLLDNAIRYTPEGDVRVGLAVADGTAELRVTDTGVGIPSADLGRIFERFYRVDPARSRDTGGTGLGLAIVRHVADAHGGEVKVRSVLGAGTTFTVRLPLGGKG
jgi:two-component system sensor histidine kinase SenX3